MLASVVFVTMIVACGSSLLPQLLKRNRLSERFGENTPQNRALFWFHRHNPHRHSPHQHNFKHNHAAAQWPCPSGEWAPKPVNKYIDDASISGSWVGTCECNDGSSYLVGDGKDSCSSINCIHGKAVDCAEGTFEDPGPRKVVDCGVVSCSPCKSCRSDEYELTRCTTEIDTVCIECPRGCASCSDGSTCTSCEVSFYMRDSMCYQELEDGEECVGANQCESGLCKERCCTSNDKNCVSCGKYGECSKCGALYSVSAGGGECVCTGGYTLESGGRIQCQEKKEPGESCDSSEQCSSDVCGMPYGNQQNCCSEFTAKLRAPNGCDACGSLGECVACAGEGHVGSDCASCAPTYFLNAISKRCKQKFSVGHACLVSEAFKCQSGACLQRCCADGTDAACAACDEMGVCSRCDESEGFSQIPTIDGKCKLACVDNGGHIVQHGVRAPFLRWYTDTMTESDGGCAAVEASQTWLCNDGAWEGCEAEGDGCDYKFDTCRTGCGILHPDEFEKRTMYRARSVPPGAQCEEQIQLRACVAVKGSAGDDRSPSYAMEAWRIASGNGDQLFSKARCEVQCALGCDHDKLMNSYCDGECNVASCGFDSFGGRCISGLRHHLVSARFASFTSASPEVALEKLGSLCALTGSTGWGLTNPGKGSILDLKHARNSLPEEEISSEQSSIFAAACELRNTLRRGLNALGENEGYVDSLSWDQYDSIILGLVDELGVLEGEIAAHAERKSRAAEFEFLREKLVLLSLGLEDVTAAVEGLSYDVNTGNRALHVALDAMRDADVRAFNEIMIAFEGVTANSEVITNFVESVGERLSLETRQRFEDTIHVMEQSASETSATLLSSVQGRVMVNEVRDDLGKLRVENAAGLAELRIGQDILRSNQDLLVEGQEGLVEEVRIVGRKLDDLGKKIASEQDSLLAQEEALEAAQSQLVEIEGNMVVFRFAASSTVEKFGEQGIGFDANTNAFVEFPELLELAGDLGLTCFTHPEQLSRRLGRTFIEAAKRLVTGSIPPAGASWPAVQSMFLAPYRASPLSTLWDGRDVLERFDLQTRFDSDGDELCTPNEIALALLDTPSLWSTEGRELMETFMKLAAKTTAGSGDSSVIETTITWSEFVNASHGRGTIERIVSNTGGDVGMKRAEDLVARGAGVIELVGTGAALISKATSTCLDAIGGLFNPVGWFTIGSKIGRCISKIKKVVAWFKRRIPSFVNVLARETVAAAKGVAISIARWFSNRLGGRKVEIMVGKEGELHLNRSLNGVVLAAELFEEAPADDAVAPADWEGWAQKAAETGVGGVRDVADFNVCEDDATCSAVPVFNSCSPSGKCTFDDAPLSLIDQIHTWAKRRRVPAFERNVALGYVQRAIDYGIRKGNFTAEQGATVLGMVSTIKMLSDAAINTGLQGSAALGDMNLAQESLKYALNVSHDLGEGTRSVTASQTEAAVFQDLGAIIGELGGTLLRRREYVLSRIMELLYRQRRQYLYTQQTPYSKDPLELIKGSDSQNLQESSSTTSYSESVCDLCRACPECVLCFVCHGDLRGYQNDFRLQVLGNRLEDSRDTGTYDLPIRYEVTRAMYPAEFEKLGRPVTTFVAGAEGGERYKLDAPLWLSFHVPPPLFSRNWGTNMVAVRAFLYPLPESSRVVELTLIKAPSSTFFRKDGALANSVTFSHNQFEVNIKYQQQSCSPIGEQGDRKDLGFVALSPYGVWRVDLRALHQTYGDVDALRAVDRIVLEFIVDHKSVASEFTSGLNSKIFSTSFFDDGADYSDIVRLPGICEVQSCELGSFLLPGEGGVCMPCSQCESLLRLASCRNLCATETPTTFELHQTNSPSSMTSSSPSNEGTESSTDETAELESEQQGSTFESSSSESGDDAGSATVPLAAVLGASISAVALLAALALFVMYVLIPPRSRTLHEKLWPARRRQRRQSMKDRHCGAAVMDPHVVDAPTDSATAGDNNEAVASPFAVADYMKDEQERPEEAVPVGVEWSPNQMNQQLTPAEMAVAIL